MASCYRNKKKSPVSIQPSFLSASTSPRTDSQKHGRAPEHISQNTKFVWFLFATVCALRCLSIEPILSRCIRTDECAAHTPASSHRDRGRQSIYLGIPLACVCRSVLSFELCRRLLDGMLWMFKYLLEVGAGAHVDETGLRCEVHLLMNLRRDSKVRAQESLHRVGVRVHESSAGGVTGRRSPFTESAAGGGLS